TVAVVSLFALIVLCLGAALVNTTETYLGGYFSFAALGIATAVLTIATVPAMIALEIMRPGGATSMIAVEIPWFGFLWILWLSTGAESAEASYLFLAGCGDAAADEFADSIALGACREITALQAFSFLNWIILFFYTTALLVLSGVAASRKHAGVWKASVATAPFFAPPAAQGVQGQYGTSASLQGAEYGTSASMKTGAVHV
ncbi:hypothetical protein B0H10DRAFT_1771114, partial [Mycena sp. CBHHK59/15]